MKKLETSIIEVESVKAFGKALSKNLLVLDVRLFPTLLGVKLLTDLNSIHTQKYYNENSVTLENLQNPTLLKWKPLLHTPYRIRLESEPDKCEIVQVILFLAMIDL